MMGGDIEFWEQFIAMILCAVVLAKVLTVFVRFVYNVRDTMAAQDAVDKEEYYRLLKKHDKTDAEKDRMYFLSYCNSDKEDAV